MERYFHNEPDDEDENDGEMEHFVRASKQDIIDVMHMELAEQELNERLLSQAHKIAHAEWRWPFRSTKYKMKKIERIYEKLKKIASEE